MVASAAYGLCQQALPGLVLKYGVVAVMAVAHVAVNSLARAVAQAAMLEKQLELLLATLINCVQVVQDVAHRTQMELRDFLVMSFKLVQVLIPSAYAPAMDLAEEAAVGRLSVVTTIVLQ
jgi:hypothetical protein